MYSSRFALLGLLALLLAACGPQAPAAAGLPVVATTPILGDVVAQVGGRHISLSVLIPAGVDPHAFDPAPQDAALIVNASIIFANGLGLEEQLQPLLHDAEDGGKVVIVSDGVATIEFGVHDDDDHEDEDGEHDDDDHEGDDHEHAHGGADPHVWMDPRNVMVWADNIAAALAAADPQHAADYRANAAAYKAALQDLDVWAGQQLAQLPQERRQLVTDHEAFGYFAARYGFEIVGALVPGYSTLSEPSASELAALESAISQYSVPAIFVGVSVNPQLAERVAADTGVALVPLYTESLSEPGGPAAGYIEMMRYNVAAIVSALAGP